MPKWIFQKTSGDQQGERHGESEPWGMKIGKFGQPHLWMLPKGTFGLHFPNLLFPGRYRQI